jgi:HlyD family secretion protein
MRRALLVLILLTVVAATIAWANLRRDLGALGIDWQLVKETPHEVLAEPPSLGPIVQTVTAPGAVEPIDEAEIASQIVGRVIEVRVKDGDRVKRGDVLVKLDPTEAKARVDSASARAERLRTAIDQARRDLEKAGRDESLTTKLRERGFANATELADARTTKAKSELALAMCENDLRESEAMRKTYEQELSRTQILAPIDGVVAGLSVDVGEVVIAGTTNLKGSVLMTVADPRRLRVRADVDETDVPLVRPGQPAKVFLQADERNPVAGSVDRVAPKGTKKEEVVSFETLIAIGEDQPVLRPGMSSTVEVEVRRAERAVGVPVQAVVHRRRKDLPDTPEVRAWAERHAHSPGEKAQEAELRYIKIVFVVEGNVARARPVETGLSDERRIEILSGVEPTDRVVVAPFRALDELKDGSPVVPVRVLTEGGARR